MDKLLKLEHDGVIFNDAKTARSNGVPASIVGAGLKAMAALDIGVFAEGYRAKLASQSAGKLAEYRIKEEIARDPSSASEVELELLSREAKARGINRTGLIGLIKDQTVAYRQIALLIGAIEAEAKAAISTIADDAADIEVQIQTMLYSAIAQAEIAFTEAKTLLNG